MNEDIERPEAANAKASFGFADVAGETKQGLVNEVFAKVARRYLDLVSAQWDRRLARLKALVED